MIRYSKACDEFAVSPDKRFLVGAGGFICHRPWVVDLIKGEERPVDDQLQINRRCEHVRFLNKLEFIFVNEEKELCKYHIENMSIDIIRQLTGAPSVVATNGDLIAVNDAKLIQIFDMHGQIIHELKGGRSNISDLHFLSLTPHKLISTGDRTISIWDLSVKKPKAEKIKGLKESGSSLAISEDEQFIAAGCYDGVSIFDLNTLTQKFDSLDLVGQYCKLRTFANGQLFISRFDELYHVDPVKGDTRIYLEEMPLKKMLSNGATIFAGDGQGVSISGEIPPDFNRPTPGNSSKIVSIFKWADNIISLGTNDIVKRDLDCHVVESWAGRTVHLLNLIPTKDSNIFWLIDGFKARLFDVKSMAPKTELQSFKSLLGTTFRVNDDFTLFISAALKSQYGGVEAYDDNGDLLWKFEKLELRSVIPGWLQNNDNLIIPSGEKRYAVFNIQKQELVSYGLFPYCVYQAITDDINRMAYLRVDMAPEIGKKDIHIVCVDMDNPLDEKWRIKTHASSFVGWLKTNEDFLFVGYEGTLSVVNVKNQNVRTLDHIAIPNSCSYMIDGSSLYIGNNVGNVEKRSWS